MIILLVLACAPDRRSPIPPDVTFTPDPSDSAPTDTATAETGSTVPLPDHAVTMDHADVFLPPSDEREFGTSVVGGIDIDQDGTAEFAVAAMLPPDSGDASSLRVFEGLNEIAARFPYTGHAEEFFANVVQRGDVDGDGFVDLLYTTVEDSQGRLHVVTSPALADDAIHAVTDPEWVPEVGSTFLSSDRQLLSWWVAGGTSFLTWYAPPLEANVPKKAHEIPTSEVTIARIATNQEGYVDSWAGFAQAVLLEDRDEPQVFGARFAQPFQNSVGTYQLFLCPVRLGLTFPDDCDLIGPDSDQIGYRQLAFDLDGDGSLELISSRPQPDPGDGTVMIFDRDGTLRATLHGTKAAQLGFAIDALVDDHGEAWLLVSQTNLRNHQLGTVYAFRGDQLFGDLDDVDADRLYVAPDDPEIGRSLTSYRETPDGPVLLVLGSPYGGPNGDGIVYRLPFEPPP